MYNGNKPLLLLWTLLPDVGPHDVLGGGILDHSVVFTEMQASGRPYARAPERDFGGSVRNCIISRHLRGMFLTEGRVGYPIADCWGSFVSVGPRSRNRQE